MTKLLDQLACSQLLVAFGHALDRHDLDGMVAQFAEDGIMHSMTGVDIVGRDAIRAHQAKRDPKRITRHVLAPPHIVVGDDGKAEGLVDFAAYVAMATDAAPPAALPLDGPFAVGEFQAYFRQTPEGWRIAGFRSVPLFKS